MLVDDVRLTLHGGTGGRGAVTFRKEKFVPFGGPDGGDGGVGGSIVLLASQDVLSLAHLSMTPELRADPGEHGRRAKKIGKAGADLVIEVPVGTVAVLSGGQGEVAFDLKEGGQREVVCLGGVGGRGNKAFATSTMKAPRMAESGEPGEVRKARLTYKMMSDAAMVGMSNSGKSELLNRMTGAGVRVADYRMTTIDPVIGVMEYEWNQYLVVEIPATWTGDGGRKGGALKHAHRASVVAILLDGTVDDIRLEYERVAKALDESDGLVASKPRIAVANKADLVGRGVSRAKNILGGLPGVRQVHVVSAVTGEGVEGLIGGIVEVAGSFAGDREAGVDGETPALRPAPMGSRISVKKEADAYVVHAGSLERLVRGTDISDWEARMQLMSLLEKAGVHQALQRAGVGEGDTVIIGGTELEWT